MAKQEFDPRRAAPGEKFEFADGGGTLHTFSANAKGVIHPRNAMEAAIADSRGLPVARTAAKRSSTTKRTTKRSTKSKPAPVSESAAGEAPATTEAAPEPSEG